MDVRDLEKFASAMNEMRHMGSPGFMVRRVSGNIAEGSVSIVIGTH